MKLLHLTPGILFSTDGRISRQVRFDALLPADIEGTSNGLSLHARFLGPPPVEARSGHDGHEPFDLLTNEGTFIR